MNDSALYKRTIHNGIACLTVDLCGGAITDFHLNDEEQINPLSFAFTKEQMPPNNKAGAVYQGHFLCLGRWGLPSGGEIKAGVPNHGQVANILWNELQQNDEQLFRMHVNSELEGLYVKREIKLHKENAVFTTKETVINTQPLGRLYNMVQHPTLAYPFLDDAILINCSGTKGFDQSNNHQIFNWHYPEWNDSLIDLRAPAHAYNGVFTFVADQSQQYAWITAYSLKHQLLFGYVWKRSDYPWIHLWQHFEEGKIKYRGIEFGTAALHLPFKEILEYGTTMFGEKTTEYIDAGEQVCRKYTCFLCKAKDVRHVTKVEINKIDEKLIVCYNDEQQIKLSLPV
jgi:hypothetical protein